MVSHCTTATHSVTAREGVPMLRSTPESRRLPGTPTRTTLPGRTARQQETRKVIAPAVPRVRKRLPSTTSHRPPSARRIHQHLPMQTVRLRCRITAALYQTTARAQVQTLRTVAPGMLESPLLKTRLRARWSDSDRIQFI